MLSVTADEIRVEVKECIRIAAGERSWDDTRQSWLARAARRLGFTYARIKRWWYDADAIPRADEFATLQRRAALLRNLRQEIEATNVKLDAALARRRNPVARAAVELHDQYADGLGRSD